MNVKKRKETLILALILLLSVFYVFIPAINTVHAQQEQNQEGQNEYAQDEEGEVEEENGPANPVQPPSPDGFSNDGLYGCKGGFQNSVGKAHAGGIFVPVSEEAVAHNTNVLVYKECILDGIVARIRETLVSFMVKSTFNWVNTGNKGAPAFITNQEDFRLQIADKVVKEFTEGDKTDVIFDDFKQDIRRALARVYAQQTRKPELAYKHTIPEDKKEEYTDFINGRAPFSWDMFLLSTMPENNPVGVYVMSLNEMLSDINQRIQDEYTELNWGQGFKSHKNCKQIPASNGTFEEYCEIATPGSLIKSIIDYTSLTGLRQTESADEIDEIMGSLMSNIHTQILTSAGGLRGITRSTPEGRSYVDRIAQDAASRTRAEYTDVGTDFLGNQIATEAEYGATLNQTKTALESTAKQIEDKEKACWKDLLERAKADLIKEVERLACDDRRAGDLGGGTIDQCTIRGNATVKILADTIAYSDLEQAIKDGTGRKEYYIKITAKAADKTVETIIRRHSNNSYEVIAQNISPLLRQVNQSIDESDKALQILQNLQNSLQTSNTPGNTRFVLQQVDQLVAEGTLHSQGDVIKAQAQHEKTVDSMEDLYDDTVENWDKTWCNPDNWRDQIK